MVQRTGLSKETYYSVVPIKISNDPADVTAASSSRSMTPVFGTPMSFPAHIRGKKGAYFVLMLLNKGFKNLDLAFKRYFSLADNPWGENSPGILAEWSTGRGTMRCLALMNCGDSRALPEGSGAMQTSRHGACVHCWIIAFIFILGGASVGTYY
jgi:hypothetical protein